MVFFAIRFLNLQILIINLKSLIAFKFVTDFDMYRLYLTICEGKNANI